ncbi:hypothetical protein SEA_ALBRIGHT_67 [Microbacterium phage Albright]|uniref:hypothetical protein n=1 Tax=Microbacterium phage Albright TaxID=2816467 RepID=UPI0018A422B1|nr:hypothetical protein QDW28_gp67 [Microbacterium phage Albright]YP_010753287.1 hypothetical protein QDW35_gp66 [Microbacterium phage DickRichards]QOP66383.1 hypothetical protein SEA_DICKRICHARDS_66 [Microbacterium phage DickRichards]QTF82242.1 hypothetical protein SEA_ALBRIGHT_67 [Microbacterium phage Albright]
MTSSIQDLVTGWRNRSALQQPTAEEAKARAAALQQEAQPAKSLVQEYLDRRAADTP